MVRVVKNATQKKILNGRKNEITTRWTINVNHNVIGRKRLDKISVVQDQPRKLKIKIGNTDDL